MARKPNFTKDEILDCAYDILLESSLKEVTARTVAKRLNASTISIYSAFSSMGDLKNALAKRAKNKLFEYTKINNTDMEILDIGMGVCLFARDEKELFRTIFLRESMPKDFIDEVLEDFKKLIYTSFKNTPMGPELSEKTINWIMKKGWLFTQGFATLICTGFYDNPSDDEIKKELVEMGTILIKEALNNGGN
ncbi:transcriptional regulator, TetR family [Cetobacterium ceti]|uniref:Transcriptional regulator, TetR family n=1 Tax=Cetobacterium ceti TaxID=180163 RepID=A0A1T4NXW4_9FUSO|nr:TetR/AcrR family transcriptional regulator [Cetobacterium ceti]SJZ83887.1 transcriptional regulator, TetR family [Cetobacterium ceti]